jgi:hypothetical protein
MNQQAMDRSFCALQAEAQVLAGGLTDLAQRAMVYHHLYRDSGGNHAFPLIAAHGALWAGGYFRFGLRLGRLISWQYGWKTGMRREKLQQLNDFANALRDINRKVCIDTYVNFHFTRQYGCSARASNYVPPSLLHALNLVHAACARGMPLTDGERRKVFEAHFLHEQDTVVSDTLHRASTALNWQLVKFLALRPPVKFAFLPGRKRIRFRNFADKHERIENGLRAFDCAASVGWRRVEHSLAEYGLLSNSFFVNPIMYFQQMRSSILMAARQLPIQRSPNLSGEFDGALST